MTRTFDPLQTSDLQEIRAYALDELERFLYHAGNPQVNLLIIKTV